MSWKVHETKVEISSFFDFSSCFGRCLSSIIFYNLLLIFLALNFNLWSIFHNKSCISCCIRFHILCCIKPQSGWSNFSFLSFPFQSNQISLQSINAQMFLLHYLINFVCTGDCKWFSVISTIPEKRCIWCI